ncbi:hypothetical protein PUN28_014538 [Cardiocondyla obscurior]|uniref:Uncharacterized protein n=1 Tax=Cardiocondyla obscurior TaxID=286306 RepID=A0AAW2F0J9_9HYME
MTDRDDFRGPSRLSDRSAGARTALDRARGRTSGPVSGGGVQDAELTGTAADPAGRGIVNVCRHIGSRESPAARNTYTRTEEATRTVCVHVRIYVYAVFTATGNVDDRPPTQRRAATRADTFPRSRRRSHDRLSRVR